LTYIKIKETSKRGEENKLIVSKAEKKGLRERKLWKKKEKIKRSTVLFLSKTFQKKKNSCITHH
jgi:hypothetical protein